MHTLIDLGIKQFVYLPLECFSEGFYHELSNCRALPEYREKKTKCTDYILVLSQDCDIDSASFKYIELLVFRKAKERDVKNGTSIEYARSVHKILLKDRENFLLRKDETSLVSKASLLKELEAIKEKGKETLERINLRLSKLKKEGVDTSHFETLCENILKKQ